MLLLYQRIPHLALCIGVVFLLTSGASQAFEPHEMHGFPEIQLGDVEATVRRAFPGQPFKLSDAYPPPVKSVWLPSGLLIDFVDGRVISFGFAGVGKNATFGGVSVGFPASNLEQYLGKPDGISSTGLPFYLDNAGRHVSIGVEKKSQTVFSIIVVADPSHPEFVLPKSPPPPTIDPAPGQSAR